MTRTETALPGVVILEPRVFADHRGWFFESYHTGRFEEMGIRDVFLQDNQSRSIRGTVRGLHFQLGAPQTKLVRVLQGAIWDVAVDVRHGSPTFGQWVGVELSAEDRRQLYVPPGFAHGFSTLSGTADVLYKCSALYAPDLERAVRWNDPCIGVDWRLEGPPVLSERDACHPYLSDLDSRDLPPYQG